MFRWFESYLSILHTSTQFVSIFHTLVWYFSSWVCVSSFMLEGVFFGIICLIYNIVDAFYGTLMLCFLLRSPKLTILVIRFLLTSLEGWFIPTTSYLFLFLDPFILELMVDWVDRKLDRIFVNFYCLDLCKACNYMFFIGAILITILFYLVCLMMLLQNPLLLDFFHIWLQHDGLLPLVHGLVRWLVVTCWCFKRNCNVLS